MQLRSLIEAAASVEGNYSRLAKRLGVSRGNVTDWRQGTKPCPDHQILRMAQIAGMNPVPTAVAIYRARLVELMERDENSPPAPATRYGLTHAAHDPTGSPKGLVSAVRVRGGTANSQPPRPAPKSSRRFGLAKLRHH